MIRPLLITCLVCALSACSSDSGGGGQAGSTSGGSDQGGTNSGGSTNGGTGGSAGSSGGTGGSGQTTGGTSGSAGSAGAINCPMNECYGSDAGAEGYCSDDQTRVACSAGPDGCLIPGETNTCTEQCLKGTCCDNSSFDPDPDCVCISNPCLDNGLGEGWHCLPDGRSVVCSEFDCIRPANDTPKECEAGVTCDPGTGTCGGCDPNDQCYGFGVEGRKVCAGGLNEATCGLVNGCMVQTNVTACQKACAFGTGCCGGSGDPCCKGVSPSCFDGLSCVNDVCQ